MLRDLFTIGINGKTSGGLNTSASTCTWNDDFANIYSYFWNSNGDCGVLTQSFWKMFEVLLPENHFLIKSLNG